jgi:integrase
VIDACPDAEWRLLFGLARYAGLRIPSESHRLTWADVDFERARLTVHSPRRSDGKATASGWSRSPRS